MKIITSAAEMQQLSLKHKSSGNGIGFVPTMGFLHEGHTTLLKRARSENGIVVLSIFVNPLQFGPGEDLDAYPRDFERDTRATEREGVDYLFYPAVDEMYPNKPSVKVTVQERTDVLCGKSRPGHFDGVATVLTKLFHIIQPDKVYFGLKDAQQVAVVEGLVSDFNFPLEIIPVETVREEDGLAKSSRNVYLRPEERTQAAELYQSLIHARKLIENGERRPDVIAGSVRQHITSRCKATIDYIEIYSYPDLNNLERLEGKVIIALAIKFERARLIDNIILNVEEL
ncbi:pantoate--beta-alanine ligase [Bacillus sp. T33-2]|uniref:pantoate--beta-alanine ligase n=1 Tax=Bacillus sp. T33-2 TaxID=2054168 RepID=UPI000C78EC90|nr:pantoate--beta-alanine ligase [Bacillus sp. T33-2]PLR99720.1 pantoate--beta-alanine ligase [Bacillus sp. T33-2]